MGTEGGRPGRPTQAVRHQGRSYPKIKCTQICLKVVTLPHLAEVALRQGGWGPLAPPPEALGEMVQNPAFLQFPGTKNDPTETQFS